jgi:hypothetical protein
MKRRVIIFTISGILSLIMVVLTMQMVCYFLNRIFGYPPIPKHNVMWIVK